MADRGGGVSKTERRFGSHIQAAGVAAERGLRVEDRGWSGAFVTGAFLSPSQGNSLARSSNGFSQASAMSPAAKIISRRRRMENQGS